MKTNNIILPISIAIFFSLVGCGEIPDNQQQEIKKTKVDNSTVTEENYVELAKFYYAQSFMARGVSKSRSMQHLDKSKSNRSKDKNSFYIKSSKTDNDKINSFIISKGDKLVSVEIGSKDVKISLHGSKKATRETISLDAFRNLDIRKD